MTPWALYPQTPLPVTLDSVTGRFPIMTTSSPHTHKAHPRSKWKWKINEKRLPLSLDKFFKGFPYLCFSLGWYLVDYVWGNSAWRTRQSDQPETKSGSFENYFAKSFWDTLPATQKQQMDKGQFLIFFLAILARWHSSLTKLCHLLLHCNRVCIPGKDGLLCAHTLLLLSLNTLVVGGLLGLLGNK